MNRLFLYIEEILKWNKRHNLVKADAKGIVVKHILDSLAAVPILKDFCNQRYILDVGSGAGFPGIPLAVFLNQCRFTLCERSAVRSTFLRNVCLLLNLKNVSVKEVEVKQLQDYFGLVLFRAFSSIENLLPTLKRIVTESGIIFAYKGRLENLIHELKQLTAYFKHIEIKKLNVPFLSAQRHMMIMHMRYRYA